MNRLTRAWSAYYFAPAGPTDLGACRTIIFGLLLAYYLPIDFAAWAGVSRVAWMPIWPFAVLHLGVPGHGTLVTIEWVWKGSLLLAALGLFTRPATVAAFVGGFYLLGLPHNFGKVDHYDALAVFILLIFAAARCGDAVSLDSLWFRKQLPADSGEYRWPIRAAWVAFAVVFFSAGASKLLNSGAAWVTSDHMVTVLLKEQYNNDPLVAWGAWIARHPPLPNLMAAMTLLLELGYPLALFSRRARLFFVPGMFAAQLGIRVLMGPAFWPFLICSAVWVPWSYVWPFARREAMSARNSPSFRPRSAQV